MSFLSGIFGKERGTPPGAAEWKAPETGKAPELSVRRSEGGLDKTPKQTPKSVLAERYHQAREMPAGVRAKVFGAPESMNAPFDTTEKEVADAVDALTMQNRMTTVSIGKRLTEQKSTETGRWMAEAGVLPTEHSDSFRVMQKEAISKLEHQVDTTGEIDISGIAGDEDVESWIERDKKVA
jgi:hypothetical protein